MGTDVEASVASDTDRDAGEGREAIASSTTFMALVTGTNTSLTSCIVSARSFMIIAFWGASGTAERDGTGLGTEEDVGAVAGAFFSTDTLMSSSTRGTVSSLASAATRAAAAPTAGLEDVELICSRTGEALLDASTDACDDAASSALGVVSKCNKGDCVPFVSVVESALRIPRVKT